MKDLSKKIEMAANAGILVTSLIFATVLIKDHFVAHQNAGPSGVRVGATLSVPAVNWSASRRSLVLALREGCRYCADSAPFYRRLIANDVLKRDGVRVLAILPQDVAESRKYLAQLGLDRSDVRQEALPQVGVFGTPTVILVDDHGVVLHVWKGLLPPERETEVLATL